jgi:hypothetical protein
MATEQISKAEYDALQAARDKAVDDGLADIAVPDTTGPTLAMLGGHYHIGNVALPQFNLRTVALLSIAGVDLLDGGGGDTVADMMRDTAVALYVIANPDACDVLMGVRQRTDALARLEHLAEKSPEMFTRYMDKLDAIGGSAFAELEGEAVRFLGEIEGATIDEIAEVIGQMAEDFIATMNLLPGSDEDDGDTKN